MSSRFHAPEGSVTEGAVRQAFAHEYMVPVEAAWELEQALTKARADCHTLRLYLRAADHAYTEINKQLYALKGVEK
jgi:hypothetical protein